MKPIAILLIFAFAGIGVFGFTAMNHGNSHEGCIAATLQGMECPGVNIPLLSLISFHLKAFQSFSLAIDSFLAVGVLLAFLGFLAFFFSKLSLVGPLPQTILKELQYSKYLLFSPFHPTYKLEHWFNLALIKNPALLS